MAGMLEQPARRASPAAVAGGSAWPVCTRWLRRGWAALGFAEIAALALGLVAAQLVWWLEPPSGPFSLPAAVLRAGARAGLLGWVALRLATAWRCDRRGRGEGEGASQGTLCQTTDLSRHRLPAGGGSYQAASAARLLRQQLRHLGPWRVTLLASAAIVVGPFGSATRAMADLLGYWMVAVPTLWLARRWWGPAAAARAALALAILVLWPLHLNLVQPPATVTAEPASTYRWAAGWPDERWVLRHRLRLPGVLPGRRATLVLPLAAAYTGPARVLVSINGRATGAARLQGHATLEIDVPADLLVPGAVLAFDLRQEPAGAAMRLIAQRWTAGTSLGAGASSYFDGHAWHDGTFNDALGRPQPGAYLAYLTFGRED
jgi:hypothetical protein